MKRWNFVSGLTVILLLVLVLSGFSVAVIRSLTGDLDKLIASNYDTIRAIREIRDSSTRLNAHYRKANTTSEVPSGHGVYEHERKTIEERAGFVLAQAQNAGELKRAELLDALVRDYLGAYQNYLGLRGLRSPTADDRFATATTNIAQLTGEISNAAADVISDQERQIFDRRDRAVARVPRQHAERVAAPPPPRGGRRAPRPAAPVWPPAPPRAPPRQAGDHAGAAHRGVLAGGVCGDVHPPGARRVSTFARFARCDLAGARASFRRTGEGRWQRGVGADRDRL